MDKTDQTPNPEPGTEQPTPAPGTDNNPNPEAGGEQGINLEKNETTPTETKEETKTETQPGTEINWEQKFKDSQAEANRLMGVVKTNNIDPKTGEVIKKEETTTPQEHSQLTDAEISKAIPGFANMSEGEKEVIRNAKGMATKVANLEKLVAEMADERQFNKDFKSLTGKEEFKSIADMRGEFEEFAYNEDNVGIKNIETVAKIFLADKGLNKTETQKEEPRPGLEPGGGSKTPKKTGTTEYTAEEAAKMRKEQPRKYNKLVSEGKLKIKD